MRVSPDVIPENQSFLPDPHVFHGQVGLKYLNFFYFYSSRNDTVSVASLGQVYQQDQTVRPPPLASPPRRTAPTPVHNFTGKTKLLLGNISSLVHNYNVIDIALPQVLRSPHTSPPFIQGKTQG